jgi:hypothetical protein
MNAIARETFAADVARSFEFLESEYGMRREAPHLADDGAWAAYSNANVRVIVEHELGGYCGVTVIDLRYIKRDPLERAEFDLEEIIAVSGARPPRRQDAKSMTEAIAKAAETLRSVGAPVLKGEFETLHARQRKLAEALRHHNPL